MKYPIAEIFHSIQGEGVWTGTPMMFVRLAGCNVGKYATPGQVFQGSIAHLSLSSKHSICTTCSGENFVCDTDYHKSEELTGEEIASQLTEYHACITGGEPFLYSLGELVSALTTKGVHMIHIETSGTKPIKTWLWKNVIPIWVTCSPKEGFLPENYSRPNEWKFLAGPNFDVAKVVEFLHNDTYGNIYIQPINGIDEPDAVAVQRVLTILKQHPEWRLSAQLHKYLGER